MPGGRIRHAAALSGQPRADLHAVLGPAHGARTHLAAAGLAPRPQGGLGDNWGNLASRFTITDPWDLIYYNFRTEKPREVNWYMHHYLGCWKTKDNKNFCFDEAEIGRLYIPPLGWTRGTGLLPFEAQIAEVLERCRPKFPTLYWQKTWVGPTGFGKVIRAIRDGRIKVTLKPGLTTPASYDPIGNEIFIKSVAFADKMDLPVLIHEAAHAILDVNKADLTYWKHEFLGFLTKALFAYRVDPKWAEVVARSTTVALPYRHAFILGYYVHKDGKTEKMIDDHDKDVADFRDPSSTINPVQALKLAIQTDAHYIAQGWWKRMALDGIPEPV